MEAMARVIAAPEADSRLARVGERGRALGSNAPRKRVSGCEALPKGSLSVEDVSACGRWVTFTGPIGRTLGRARRSVRKSASAGEVTRRARCRRTQQGTMGEVKSPSWSSADRRGGVALVKGSLHRGGSGSFRGVGVESGSERAAGARL
jgi:hypothetical protein